MGNARHKYYTARVSIRKCMLKLVSQKKQVLFQILFNILEYNMRSQFDLIIIIIRCQNTLSLNIMLTISLHSADNNK